MPSAEQADVLAPLRAPENADCKALRRSDCADVRSALDEALEVVAATDPTIFRTNDVVHHDFHHRNLLVHSDTVVAVFDWEGARAGDSRLDLCTLGFWLSVQSDGMFDPAARDLVDNAITESVEPRVRAAMTAHIAVGLMGFGLRSDATTLGYILSGVRRWCRPRWLPAIT